MTSGTLRRLAPALLLLVSTGAAAEGAWMPLVPGSTATYRTHTDVTLRGESQRTVRRFHRGRMREVIEADAQPGRTDIVRTHTQGAMDSPGAGPTVERERLIVSRRGDAVRLHAVLPLDPDSEVDPVRYDDPVQLLPERVRPGVQWIVGELRSGAVMAVLKGEVVGRESLTLEGTPHDDTLHVRYQGPVKGAADLALPGGAARVESGDYTRDSWLVQGIGIVQEITEYRLRARYLAANDETADGGGGADGGTVTVVSVSTRRLEQHTPAP